MNNNLYLNIPSQFTSKTVEYKKKDMVFSKFCVKCGKAEKQSVKERTAQEGRNAGGFETLYQFRVDKDVLRKKYNENKNNFDIDLKVFGHSNIANQYSKTIWSCFNPNIKKIKFCEALEKDANFGNEYMDIAPIVNEAFARNPEKKKMLKEMLSESDEQESRILIINVVKDLITPLFDEAVNKYVAKKTDVKTFEPFAHQQLMFDYMKVNDFQHLNGHAILELPPRWGKTLFGFWIFTKLFTNKKLCVVNSYVKTVLASYIKEFNAFDFSGIKMIDLDDHSNVDLSTIKKGDKVLVVMPTTGRKRNTDEMTDADVDCWNKRCNVLAKIVNKIGVKTNEDTVVINEEADYGNHTDRANTAFRRLMKVLKQPLVLSLTGTDAYKAEKVTSFGKVEKFIVVNPNDFMQIIA